MEMTESTKMNFEECFDNLLNTRDMDIYLDMLKVVRSKYLIIICVKDIFGKNIPDSAFEKLGDLGFSALTKTPAVMYIGICSKGVMVLDKCADKPDDPVVYDGEVNGQKIHASSKSWNGGNVAEIIINDTNYSLNERGLNIVLYDCENKTAVDSVSYDSYMERALFYRKNLQFDDNYFDTHFYIPKKYFDIWKKPYSKKYFNNRKLSVIEVENGIILPNKFIDGAVRGGVCDADFNFISGHETAISEKAEGTRHISGSYKVAECDIQFIDETVVYGGTMLDHPGHLLVECFADRVWWFVENTETEIKLAFIDDWGDGTARFTTELLELFGLSKDRIIICKKPTRFKKIIVPEQSTINLRAYEPYDYTKEFCSVFERIKNNVKPSSFKKIYFTKSKSAKSNIVGEDYFIEFYKAKGFKIINPEDHTMREKVEFLVGADEFITPIGTNSHYALFCKPDVKMTVLSRTDNHPLAIQNLINTSAGIKEVYNVNVSMNFLQKNFSWGISLMGVTDEFRKYVKNVYNEEVNVTLKESLSINILDYLKKFPEYNSSPVCFNFIKNQKMLSVIQYISEVFCGEEFDTSKLDLTTNEDILRGQVKQLTTELDAAKKRITELENDDTRRTKPYSENTIAGLEKQISELRSIVENLLNRLDKTLKSEE